MKARIKQDYMREKDGVKRVTIPSGTSWKIDDVVAVTVRDSEGSFQTIWLPAAGFAENQTEAELVGDTQFSGMSLTDHLKGIRELVGNA